LMAMPAVHDKEGIKYHLYHVFPEEMAHIYFVYGITQYEMAREHTLAVAQEEAKGANREEKIIEEKRNEAFRLLRFASGIFAYIHNFILPSLLERNAANRAPDILMGAIDSLNLMCSANASELAIQSAIAKGVSEALIAKLCLGTMEKFASARAALIKGLGPILTAIDHSLLTYFQSKTALYEVRNRKFLAFASQKDSEHGKAVAFFQAAKAIADDIKIATSTSTPLLQELIKEVSQEQASLNKLYETARIDNSKVYFALIPQIGELVIPPSKFMVKEIDYQPPKLLAAPFFDNIQIIADTPPTI